MAETITASSLKKMFGPHAEEVLCQREILESIEQEPRKQKKYKVLKELPPADAVKTMVEEHYTMPVKEAIETAFTCLQELGQECRDIVDGAPEGLNQTQRILTFEETADALECLSAPDGLEDLSDEIKVLILPGDGSCRAARCGDTCSIMESAIGALEAHAVASDTSPERRQAIELLIGEVREAIDGAEACEFPGMFG